MVIFLKAKLKTAQWQIAAAAGIIKAEKDATGGK
jgi:hypothetical protein